MLQGEILRVILGVFACYRLAQFLCYDDGPFNIFSKLRKFVGVKVARGNEAWSSIAGLMNCPYCMGVWMAALLLYPILRPFTLGDIFLLWQGLAGAQAFIHREGYKE